MYGPFRLQQQWAKQFLDYYSVIRMMPNKGWAEVFCHLQKDYIELRDELDQAASTLAAQAVQARRWSFAQNRKNVQEA